MGCSVSKGVVTGRASLRLWPQTPKPRFLYVVVEDEQAIQDDLKKMIVASDPSITKDMVHGFVDTDRLVASINELGEEHNASHPEATRFIVFMDMRLRNSHGIDAVKLLTPAAHQVRSPVACIAATAFHQPRDCATYKETGCVSVLCKPYDETLVKRVIHHVKTTPMVFQVFTS